MENYLTQVLRVANLKKLPAQINTDKEYDGLAVIKVKKINGHEIYAIGRYIPELKKTVVAQDFDKKRVEEILSVHPYQNTKYGSDEDSQDLGEMKLGLLQRGYKKETINVWAKKKCLEEIGKIKAVEKELTDLNIDDLSGTLADLNKRLKLAKDN